MSRDKTPTVTFTQEPLDKWDFGAPLGETLTNVWHARFRGRGLAYIGNGDWTLSLSAPNYWVVETCPFPSSLEERATAVSIVKVAWTKYIVEQILNDRVAD